MSLLITEALAVGAKEALKAAAVLSMLRALTRATPQSGKGLLAGFYPGLAASVCAAALVFLFPSPDLLKPLAAKLAGYGFFVFFLASAASFELGAERLSESPGAFSPKTDQPSIIRKSMPIVAFLGSLLYFAPDFAGSAVFLRELGALRENPSGVYLSASAGFAAASVAGYLAARRLGVMEKFLSTAGFLLMLALIKLLAGGVRGFSEFSLIPAVQRGVMKFVHDITHQTLVFFMVPDHPLLKVTVWNFIGILFGPSLALYIVLAILLVPPLLLMKRYMLGPLPEPSDRGLKSAERRARKADIRAARRRRSLPAIVFVLGVLVFWFSGKSGEVSALYNPKPLPVIEDKGQIVIPISTPAENLLDGAIHKFSVSAGQESVVFFVIRRPDGRLVVCLDDCEICPAKGYGQSGGHVVCLYCNTPIPLDTVSEPGGCNPIPLKAAISERDVRVDFDYLRNKWEEEKSKQ